MIKLLRGGLSLGVLLVLVAGVPIALHVLAGPPLPSRIPSVEQVWGFLMRPDDGTAFLAVIKILAWGGWASFTGSALLEIAARIRGIKVTPRVPGLGLMQRMAAHLITSVAVAIGSPATALAAHTAPAPAATPPAQVHDADDTEPPEYRVRQGDTLTEIADRKLGKPAKWKKIWRINRDKIRDPDLIYPGWRLTLPAREKGSRSPPTRRPPTDERAAPAPAPSRATPSADASPEVRDTPPVTIALPSGSIVGLAFAAGISTALVAGRIRRRWFRRPQQAVEAAPPDPEPPVPPAVQHLRNAHIRHAYTDHQQPPPGAWEQIDDASADIDVPDTLTIGTGQKGEPVRIPLSGLCLSLTGPGAEDVARACALDLLASGDRYRTEIVMTQDEAAETFGLAAGELVSMAASLPGLTLTGQPDAYIEQMCVRRARIIDDRDIRDVVELRQADPGEPLPAIVRIGRTTEAAQVAATAKPYGIGLITLAPPPAGDSIAVPEQFTTGSGNLESTQLVHLAAAEAADLVRAIAVGNGHAPSEDAKAPEPAAADRLSHPSNSEQLVRLRLLGIPAITVGDAEFPLSSRSKSFELLVYLAIHGPASKDKICADLWPDRDTDRAGSALHNAVKNLRIPLREATRRTGAMFVMVDATTYRLDPLIGSDLFDLRTALTNARTAIDRDARIAALEQVLAVTDGELAEGLTYEWVDEQRYPLAREQADALSGMAELLKKTGPERALEVLEQVLRLDQDCEETYLSIIEIQLDLGRPDTARRTARLLRNRSSQLNLEPSARAREVLGMLFNRRPPQARHENRED